MNEHTGRYLVWAEDGWGWYITDSYDDEDEADRAAEAYTNSSVEDTELDGTGCVF
ncbi:MAG: hypothetical protein ACRC6V_01175 [Bacteroidales bacterium]